MYIKRANFMNAEDILKLQKLAYQSEAAIYNDYNLPPLKETLEEIREEFQNKTFLIAELDGRIIGSVKGSLVDGTCYIGRLVVHPEFQNQGIGTKLLNEIEKVFSHASRFELFTGHRSERSLHLYHKVGYKAFKSETVHKDLKLVYLEKIPEKEG